MATFTTLSLDGVPAHVETAGRGSPPLLVIGGAVPPGWADGMIAQLAVTRRVVYFDYREPPGWSGQPSRRTQVALAADAFAVLDHLQIETADVLGYSRGAVAAYAAAFEEPQRVRRLVLLAPVAPYEDMLIEPSAPLPADREQLMDVLTRAAFTDRFVNQHPSVARALTQAVMTNKGTVVRVERNEEQPLPDHPAVRHPTLIITAGADRIVDRAHSVRLLEAIPRARHVVIEGGSHLVVFERPVDVARAIESFLSE